MTQSDLIYSFQHGAVSGRAHNLFIKNDVLYAYGYYFPLAIREVYVTLGSYYYHTINVHDYTPTTSKYRKMFITTLGDRIWSESDTLKMREKIESFRSRARVYFGSGQNDYITTSNYVQSTTPSLEGSYQLLTGLNTQLNNSEEE